MDTTQGRQACAVNSRGAERDRTGQAPPGLSGSRETPGRGQTVSRAVVTTYSLDLIAMLGLVLALGCDTDTEFEASPLGLVKAFDKVRGKLLVLHQLSRVVAPSDDSYFLLR